MPDPGERCDCPGISERWTHTTNKPTPERAFPAPAAPAQRAKRDAELHTAADVFAWAAKHMPGDAPGSLTIDQFLAIFTFDLTANGHKLDKPLDGPDAQAIVLHPRAPAAATRRGTPHRSSESR